MTPETSRLIAETLRLDGEATKGPWKAIKGVHYVHGTDCRVAQCGDYKDKELEEFNGKRWQSDAVVIASYRTSAPRLARIAKMQAEFIAWSANPCHSTAPTWLAAALVGAERQALPLQHVARYVLAEIEKIAKGES